MGTVGWKMSPCRSFQTPSVPSRLSYYPRGVPGIEHPGDNYAHGFAKVHARNQEGNLLSSQQGQRRGVQGIVGMPKPMMNAAEGMESLYV